MVTLEKLVELMAQADISVAKDDVAPETTFSELGLDSLDIFNFFVEVDNELGVAIPDEDFEQLNSFATLLDYVNAKA